MAQIILPILLLLAIKPNATNPATIFVGMGLIFIQSLFLYPNNTHNHPVSFLTLDSLSGPLTTLSIFIIIVTLLGAILINNTNNRAFLNLTIASSIPIILTFSTNSLLLFYIFFETSTLPLILIILIYSTAPSRLQAIYYLILYMVIFSLPLLFSILLLLNNQHTLFILTKPLPMECSWPTTILSAMTLIFLLKTPIYTIHMWLPNAHVEAPVCGSIILAGLLLNLGTYGIIRINQIIPNLVSTTNWLLLPICLVGSLLASLICYRLFDLKVIVAYLSVVHINFIIVCFFQANITSTFTLAINIIAHAFSSSCLFAIAFFFSIQYSTRNLNLIGGLNSTHPGLYYAWFIALLTNLGVPPTLNFFSELYVVISQITNSAIWLTWIITYLILSGSITYRLLIEVGQNNVRHTNALPAPIPLNIVIFLLTPLFLLSLNLELFIT